MQLWALNMLFISVADGQWSGSPGGREHFARLGLTSALLSPPLRHVNSWRHPRGGVEGEAGSPVRGTD